MDSPTGICRGDLCWRGENQAMQFGTRFAMPSRVTHLDRRDDGLWCVTLECRPKFLRVATG